MVTVLFTWFSIHCGGLNNNPRGSYIWIFSHQGTKLLERIRIRIRIRGCGLIRPCWNRCETEWGVGHGFSSCWFFPMTPEDPGFFMTPDAPGCYHRSELYSTENAYYSGNPHEYPKVGERTPTGEREGQRDSRNSEASPHNRGHFSKQSQKQCHVSWLGKKENV